ncbi:hypothetical protein HYS91_02510 [Candidatus Daviesbacteria bacterium]|nr:hypothetical protein [Candidatus Daviesbacteria bacterium]
MKTLYVLAYTPNVFAYTPTRLTVSDRKESEINKAVRTAEAAAKKPGWNSSIEFTLSDRPLTRPMRGVRVKIDATNTDGNVTSSIDLGYESWEGWESVLNRGTPGYSELPDVWFSKDFMDMAFEPKQRRRDQLRILERHKGILYEQFTSYVEEMVDENELRMPLIESESGQHLQTRRELAYNRGVLSLIMDVQDGKLSEAVLKEVWSGRYDLMDNSPFVNQEASEGMIGSPSRERE